MPISPFKPIELLQTEIQNRLTPKEKEDRLHSELRGEKYDFTIEKEGEPRDLTLSIENIGLSHNDSVNLGLRLQNYKRPTALEEWEDDLTYIYINSFLRGKGSASELGNPLMADLSVAGFSPHDVRISLWVSTTYQSGIWDAVARVALVISQYHSDWFNRLQELEDEYGDQYEDDPQNIPMGVGKEIADCLENNNIYQSYGIVLDYLNYKTNDEDQKEDQLETRDSPTLN